MYDFEESQWARRGAKTCTLILWTLAIGTVFFVAMTLSDLWSPPTHTKDFTYLDGAMTIKIDSTDPQVRATIQGVFSLEALGAVVAMGLGLFRLRRLLRTVVAGRAFSFEAVQDLAFLGNLLLAAAVVVPLGHNLLAWVTQTVMATADVRYLLSPDLVFLLSGFVVRAVALVFARGVRLEAESEGTV